MKVLPYSDAKQKQEWQTGSLTIQIEEHIFMPGKYVDQKTYKQISVHKAEDIMHSILYQRLTNLSMIYNSSSTPFCRINQIKVLFSRNSKSGQFRDLFKISRQKIWYDIS